MKKKLPSNRRMIASIAAMLLFLFTVSVGARWLAMWLYEVDDPTFQQEQAAGALLLAPVWLPILIWFFWTGWDERRRIRASVRRELYGAKLVDPSRARRLDISGKEGD